MVNEACNSLGLPPELLVVFEYLASVALLVTLLRSVMRLARQSVIRACSAQFMASIRCRPPCRTVAKRALEYRKRVASVASEGK